MVSDMPAKIHLGKDVNIMSCDGGFVCSFVMVWSLRFGLLFLSVGVRFLYLGNKNY